jgi:hypothetical protein
VEKKKAAGKKVARVKAAKKKVAVEYPLHQFHGTAEEKRAFNFFIVKFAPIMSGHFDTGFWSHLLLQISHSEPAVWHSVLALSALHENYVLYGGDDRSHQLSRPGRRMGLLHYTRAVSQLARTPSERKQSMEVVLVSCILFILLELVIGNVGMAASHLSSGIRIARSQLAHIRRFPSSGPHLIETHVVPILEHISVQSFLWGRPTPPVRESAQQMDASSHSNFASLQEARSSLFNLSSIIHQFSKIHDTPDIQKVPLKTAAAALIKEKLLTRLRQWSQAFDAFQARQKMANVNSQDPCDFTILMLQHKASLIWISNALSQNEAGFDSYTEDFDAIVSLAESLLVRNGGEPLYSFQIHSMGPLFIATTKCRNPSIRRRALSLLKQSPDREGFWDSDFVSRLLERVIEIEEEGLEDLRDSTGAVVPSEWSRVHDISVTADDDKRVLVSFRRRPDGSEAPWHYQRECFTV